MGLTSRRLTRHSRSHGAVLESVSVTLHHRGPRSAACSHQSSLSHTKMLFCYRFSADLRGGRSFIYVCNYDKRGRNKQH